VAPWSRWRSCTCRCRFRPPVGFIALLGQAVLNGVLVVLRFARACKSVRAVSAPCFKAPANGCVRLVTALWLRSACCRRRCRTPSVARRRPDRRGGGRRNDLGRAAPLIVLPVFYNVAHQARLRISERLCGGLRAAEEPVPGE